MANSPHSIRGKAVRGVAWTIGTGLLVRVLQVMGTLALTHFVSKGDVGEVSNAAIVALTANTMSTLGVANYLVSRKTDRRQNWHSTVMLAGSGLLAFGIAFALQRPLSIFLKSPELGDYLPWLLFSMMLSRVALVPERLLQQNLQFREASRGRAVGELAYTVVSVIMAMRGYGGMAVAGGNVARSIITLIALSISMPPREWLTPAPYDRKLVREMLDFGIPLGIAYGLSFASRNFDNMIVSAMFGTAVVGAYNLAYNLADVPASQIGEQVGDVLTPTFVHVEGDARKRGLIRASALLGLLVYPLAIGLGATGKTVTSTLMGKTWAPVGPMLTILAAFSVVRPVAWTLGSYLQATKHSRACLWLMVLRLILILSCVAGLGFLFRKVYGEDWGPLGACAGVVLASSLHAVASVWSVVKLEQVPAGPLLVATFRPLLACIPLVVGVLVARFVVARMGITTRGVGLTVEVVAGAIGYGVGVLLFAKDLARDMLNLLKELRRKRASGAAA